ncbi:hypothetical protein FF38_09209 [Lucilia cuprina]|uniref:SAP domain-containing protein n=1 Tax=Lucilia cuprina TaxID=7375 RepID=A0A0L0BTF2_LUCCU|nr:hypothetical protein FF38_09209 [Lucilia cuprina]
MKFDELKVKQLKKEVSKSDLPTAGNKAELQKRLIDEFKRRDIDICTRSTTSNMDLNTMFAAMMGKFAEVQETSKATLLSLKLKFKKLLKQTTRNFCKATSNF